jgi:hypothetical protein
MLGVLSSRSANSGLAGALFKKFGLFLNVPSIIVTKKDLEHKLYTLYSTYLLFFLAMVGTKVSISNTDTHI